LGRALLSQPKLLLLDEPLSGLDVAAKTEIAPYIERLHRELATPILYVSHDAEEVRRIADHLLVMEAGRIVEQAGVKDLFASPAHPYTRGLLASIPGGMPGKRLTSIPGNVPAIGQLPPGCAFAPRCPDRFEPCGIGCKGRDEDAAARLHDLVAKCFMD
jgi:oligopeptide/dipeptide ABC transporter ATP-binding protein